MAASKLSFVCKPRAGRGTGWLAGAGLAGLGIAVGAPAWAHPEDEICPQEWQEDMASPCRPTDPFAGVPEMESAQSFGEILTLFGADGIAHILPAGSDHILFVAALSLASIGLGSLLWRLGLFTVAHTLALAVAVMGGVRLPEGIVQPLITASIVFVALAGLRSRGNRPRRPAWGALVILLFGLFHGMGFAGALADLGLDGRVLVPALIGFNLGVEAGQLAVVAGVLVLSHITRTALGAAGVAALHASIFTRPLLVLIALAGAVWTLSLLSAL